MSDPPRLHTLPLGGELLDGRLRLLERLGQGGMATVYKAHHKLLDQPVAIKFIRPELFDGDEQEANETTQRFLREARLATRLVHPNIVPVREFGSSDEHGLYLVMDYCPGRTLRAMLEAVGTLSVEIAVGLMLQLLDGVAEAHRLGILHRDLKPENVIVDRKGHLRVLDFGVANLMDGSDEITRLTGKGHLVGTPLYMSPEQAQNKSIDVRSDVYAVGLMLYEMLSGQSPHASTNPLTLLAMRISEPPRPLSQMVSTPLPPGFEEVVMRAIEREPESRWPDARQLRIALTPFSAAYAAGMTFDSDTGISGPVPLFGIAETLPPGRAGLMALATPPPADDTRPPSAAAGAAPTETAPIEVLQPQSRGMRAALLVLVVLLAGGVGAWFASGDSTPPVTALHTTAVNTFGRLDLPMPPSTPAAKAKVALGAMLFHDQRLSPDGAIACSSCHPLDRFGVDGLPRSVGPNGRMTDRNTPTVFGAGLNTLYGWVGHSRTLEDQSVAALTSDHANDMTDNAAVTAVLRGIPGYVAHFEAAYPDAAEHRTATQAGHAIAAFTDQLVPRSAFDSFLDGDLEALGPEALDGLAVFISLGCTTCHVDPAVGGTKTQKLGLIHPYPTEDPGLFAVTRQPQHRNVFKVPSLRNVTRTGPWLHDGSIARLDEVVRIMAWHQLDHDISKRDVASIIAFLGALEGTPAPELLEAPTLP